MDNPAKLFTKNVCRPTVTYNDVHVSVDKFHCKLTIFKDPALEILLKEIDLLSAVFKFSPDGDDGLCGFELYDVNFGYRFTSSNEGEIEKWLILLQGMRNSANINSCIEMNDAQISIMNVIIYEKKYELLTQLNCSLYQNNCDKEDALQKQIFHLSNELFYLQEILLNYRQRELQLIKDKVKSYHIDEPVSLDITDEPVYTSSLKEKEVSDIVENEISIPLQINEKTSISAEESSQMLKWENLIIENYKPPEKLKDMIRCGIPEAFRHNVWNYCINKTVLSIRESKKPNYYKRCLEKCNQTFNLASKQIELDLLRTFPEMPCYSSLECDKIQELRNVLLAFAIHRPDIGYCQGMNRIVAIALLTLCEEEAFWYLIAIIEIMPEDYFSYSLMGAQADQRVLLELVREKCPKLNEHFNHYNVDITVFTFHWFLTLFVSCGNDKIYYRVLDCFLNEGSKILFRFAIGLLKLNQEEILGLHDFTSIHRFVQSFTEEDININLLSRIAFYDIKYLSMKAINEKRHKLTQQLCKEFAILQNKREMMKLQKISIDFDDDDDDDDKDENDDLTDEKK